MDCHCSDVKNLFAFCRYDADYNHSPALRNGHAAHWALLVGFALKFLPHETEAPAGNQDRLRIYETGSRTELSESVTLRSFPASQILVFARQGKSKHIGVWEYENLFKSNQNLNEIGRKITEAPEEYTLHPIERTLRSQVVVLQRT